MTRGAITVSFYEDRRWTAESCLRPIRFERGHPKPRRLSEKLVAACAVSAINTWFVSMMNLNGASPMAADSFSQHRAAESAMQAYLIDSGAARIAERGGRVSESLRLMKVVATPIAVISKSATVETTESAPVATAISFAPIDSERTRLLSAYR